MNQNELTDAYFEWMYQLAFPNQNEISYRRLCAYLNNVTFYPRLPMDENRAQDGEDLRYRFGYDQGYVHPEIGSMLDCRPCSMLEMMVALALRMEEDIMTNPAMGNRLPQWFMEMLQSLGLDDMTDEQFDRHKVMTVVRRFMDGKYKPNGKGGLFTIPSCERDLRTVEIWYQMNWYLNSIIYEKGC